MANKINGLTTTNGGLLVTMPLQCTRGAEVTVEVIGPGYTTHRTNCVVLYMAEGMRKVSICCTGRSIYIQRYRTFDSLEHYWSTWRNLEEAKQSKKFGMVARQAEEAWHRIFRQGG